MDPKDSFIDYYEILQVGLRADADTINGVFRHLAKRYHPDNANTGDREKFDQLTEAHQVLSDPEQRAAYDITHRDSVSARIELLDEAIGSANQDDDIVIRERVLSVLYTQRRRNHEEPAVGEVMLERALDCPREYMAFHLWYLREKGWIERTDRGFAITVQGIDEVEASRRHLRSDRLLTERAESGEASNRLAAVAGRPHSNGSKGDGWTS